MSLGWRSLQRCLCNIVGVLLRGDDRRSMRTRSDHCVTTFKKMGRGTYISIETDSMVRLFFKCINLVRVAWGGRRNSAGEKWQSLSSLRIQEFLDLNFNF